MASSVPPSLSQDPGKRRGTPVPIQGPVSPCVATQVRWTQTQNSPGKARGQTVADVVQLSRRWSAGPGKCAGEEGGRAPRAHRRSRDQPVRSGAEVADVLQIPGFFAGRPIYSPPAGRPRGSRQEGSSSPRGHEERGRQAAGGGLPRGAVDRARASFGYHNLVVDMRAWCDAPVRPRLASTPPFRPAPPGRRGFHTEVIAPRARAGPRGGRGGDRRAVLRGPRGPRHALSDGPTRSPFPSGMRWSPTSSGSAAPSPADGPPPAPLAAAAHPSRRPRRGRNDDRRRLYYGKEGEAFKAFDVRDGHGLRLLTMYGGRKLAS